jgi:hypothetical protein
MKTIVGVAIAGAAAYLIYANWSSISGLIPGAAPATPLPGGSGAGSGTTANTGGTGGSGSGTAVTAKYPLGTGPCSFTGVLAPILAAAQAGNSGLKLGPSGADGLSLDQWGYYMDRVCTGLQTQSGLNPDAVFPGAEDRGGVLNWNAFKGYAAAQGLSGRGGYYLRRAA